MHEYISGAFIGAGIASLIWGILLLYSAKEEL
jgi:hypothetical protein